MGFKIFNIFLFFYFFFWGGGGGGLRKNNIFWGINILWILFGVIRKLGYIEGSFPCILGSVLKVKVPNGEHFMGLLKFQIFFGCT